MGMNDPHFNKSDVSVTPACLQLNKTTYALSQLRSFEFRDNKLIGTKVYFAILAAGAAATAAYFDVGWLALVIAVLATIFTIGSMREIHHELWIDSGAGPQLIGHTVDGELAHKVESLLKAELARQAETAVGEH